FGSGSVYPIQNPKFKRSDVIQNLIPWSTYANNPLRGKLHRTLAAQLRHFLAGRLPTYMLPAISVLVNAYPLTTNGKVDRRALPLPDTERSGISAATTNSRSPSTPLEI